MFKQKLKEKAYKSFDKLIVDPSFIKNGDAFRGYC